MYSITRKKVGNDKSKDIIHTNPSENICLHRRIQYKNHLLN